jgi:PAS domain S-box-containing protein
VKKLSKLAYTPGKGEWEMQGLKIFHNVRPFISAIAVIAAAAALVFAIYFTQLDMQWTTFLAGVLVAAILAEAARVSRAEWFARRRTAQLLLLKDKLEREMQLRKWAEDAFAASKPRLHLLDEVLQIMVALIDIEGRCRYYNRAFMDWLHLRPEQISGRHMRDLLGDQIYQKTADEVRQALAGQAVHYERTQKMPDGVVYRLSIDHLPQFGEDGKVTGFYILINDITSPRDVRMSNQHISTGTDSADADAVMQAGKAAGHDIFVDPFYKQIAAREDAGSQIMASIERDEFCLLCQRITPLAIDSGEAEHYEILVRLKEEEENLMPPGAFFPLAEKFGLMPHLDRWVVEHVVEWVHKQNQEGGGRGGSMSFINVSGATMGDPGFPEFLQQTLLEYGVPGAALCFEIPNSELALRNAVVVEFAQRLRQCGCRVALSGFGQGKISFDLMRGFQVEFLKIDGNIILDMLRDPEDLAKVISIHRAAKKNGFKTVAEFVETDEVIAKLREIGIDFAQGFGISRPQPLAE